MVGVADNVLYLYNALTTFYTSKYGVVHDTRDACPIGSGWFIPEEYVYLLLNIKRKSVHIRQY